jgi:hypothetical protein
VPPRRDTIGEMPTLARHLRLACALLAAALLLGACGGDDAATRPVEPAPRAGAADDAESPADAAPDTDADEASDDDADPAPTRAAVGLGRRLDAFVAAYRPVTLRMNYLVAATRLRDEAISADASTPVLTARAGAVRVEIRRYQPVLETAQRAITARTAAGNAERRLQQQLLRGIEARSASLADLERSLNLDARQGAADSASDSVRKEADTRWRDGWDVSVRTAREALTFLQDTREDFLLAPAREESIR